MKRILSLTLAAVFVAAALASCALSPTSNALNANIRLTSSDAYDAAAWLGERLGDRLTECVVLGTDADGYGVDLSALENDGYFIRTFGGEYVLLAKTSDGLDRAARKYAKMVESGATIENVTYHEGYRVKRVEIASRDISEYTVFCENEPNMVAAANELAGRIEEACGVRLAVSTETAAAPYIVLQYVSDASLGNVGHRWNVTEDGAIITCSEKYKQQSASYAVRRFLEKNFDWMGLIFGIEDLSASDLVSIDVGTSLEESAAFDWARPCSSTTIRYDKLSNTDGDYGIKMLCCHGMQANRFAGELSVSPEHNWAVDQPCWLSEEFYDASREDIVAYIEGRIASGEVPGEDLIFVDVSHGDNGNWCKCKKCQKMYISEGTHTAEMLTWINDLSDELEKTYHGIKYGVFAYELTKKPPKTIKPNKHITISFCYDRCCSAHTIDGSNCTTFDQWTYSNVQLTDWLLGWLEISDYVTVWLYYMANGLLSTSFLHNIRDDVKFLYDAGVKQIFGCADDHGFSANWLAFCLQSELYWDIGMSDSDYDALCNRLLRTFYGDAAQDMRQYFEIIGRVHKYGSCYNCWGALMTDPSMCLAVDTDAFAAKYDSLLEIVERAKGYADSAIEEERMTMIGCMVIYTGSLCAYPMAKAANDTARIDELCARYALLDERLRAYGMDDAVVYKPSLNEVFPD